MAHAVRLIAARTRAPLDGVAVAVPRRAIGGTIGWLSEDEACELLVEDADRHDIRTQVEAALPEPLYDVAVLPAEGCRKRLLVSDMDSIMVTVECINELADYLGAKGEVSAITRRAMSGEVDFVAALQARAALLESLPVEVFEEVFRERVKLMPGARTLVRTIRSWGCSRRAGLGRFRAHRRTGGRRHRLRSHAGEPLGEPEWAADRASARPDPQPHQRARAAPAANLGVPVAAGETLSVGDGANDLPMLRAAGLGVAFRPAPAIAEVAPLTIRRGDLTALLYLQGVAKTDFVSS